MLSVGCARAPSQLGLEERSTGQNLQEAAFLDTGKHGKPLRASGFTLAILDFDELSFFKQPGDDYIYLKRTLPEMLLTHLASDSTLTLLERTRLQDALEELNIGAGSLVSDDTRLQLGRIIGSDRMVFGSYLIQNLQMRVDVRVIDVATSEIILAETETGTVENFDEIVNLIAQKISKKMGSRSENRSSQGAGYTSADVWKEYSKGLELMDLRAYDKAIEVFLEILKKHPNFVRAETQISLSLERMTR